MTTRIKARNQFAPRGVLALDPRAFGQEYDVLEECEVTEESVSDGVAVVRIDGPLMHHPTYFFDSYDSVRVRVAAALALNPQTVLLAIDSPGGVVSGMLDTSRAIRAMCKDAGVELIAHVEGSCTSAAFALASAASWIGASQTATIGSVGVLDGLVDATAANEAHGVSIRLIASGQRKTDGNPDAPTTEGAIAAAQAHVDELAEMFFALVAEHGYGTVDQLRDLQAGIFTGEQASKIGLISQVSTFEESVALGMMPGALSSSEATDKGTENMASPMEDAVESLRKAAAGEDEEMAKSARAALKALGEDEQEETAEEEEEETTAEEEEEEKETAEEEEEETTAEEEEDTKEALAAKGEASAHAVALKAMAEVHNMRAEQKRERMAKRRAELIATRDDLSAEMTALLKDKKTPLATVKRLVTTLKRGKPNKRTASSMAADSRVAPTRGGTSADHTKSRLPADEASALRRSMGMDTNTRAVRNDPYSITFGANAPKEGK